MSDVYTEAARVAEEHLLACYELMDSEDSPASAPFCGCPTCEVREILHAALPVLKADPCSSSCLATR